MTAPRDGRLVRRLGSFVAATGWAWLASLTVAQLAGADVRRHHFEPPGLLLGAGLLALAWASRRARPLPAVPPSAGRVRAVAVPAVAAIAAFSWALWLGPFSDDYVLRSWAVAGDWTPATWPFVRPLPLAVWQALAIAGGGWTALHALNLLLHALSSALAARLAAVWLQSPAAGLAAGLIVALFPASAEAVAWNAGVFDLMATAAVLGAVTLGVSVRASSVRDAALVACCAAGLLSKESAIAIPALLILLAWLPAPDPETRRGRLRACAISAVVAVIFLVARVLSSPAVAAHVRAWPADRRAWKDLIVRPFAGVLLPFRTDDGYGVAMYVAALCALALIALVILRLARDSGTVAGAEPPIAGVTGIAIAWILIGALPLLSAFFVSSTLDGSRFLYLPAIGLAVLLAVPFAGARGSVPKAVAAVCLAGLLGAYGMALNQERQVRGEAARTRDVLLDAAGRLARERGCGALTVRDAPDNVRGVYVFREGLREALAAVVVSGGAPCTARWTNGTLVPEP
jgi:hypothetical protein